MDWREGIRIAVRAIAGHRLRSALTIAGIVIGIATVVAFASFGASVQTDVVGEFQDTSASEVYVLSGGGFFSGSGPPDEGGALTAPVITTHDVDRIVMGGHGGERSGIARRLLGTVATTVVGEAPVTVTVVR